MVTFRANIYGALNVGMVVLQPCRWKFTQRNLVADFMRLKFTFSPKNEKSLSEPPFLDLRVMYALHP